MSSSPERKVALVTGAAGGMGKADVLALLESGWNIAACDRDEARLEDVQVRDRRSGPSGLPAYCVDVTSLKDVQEVVKDASRLGPVLGRRQQRRHRQRQADVPRYPGRRLA